MKQLTLRSALAFITEHPGCTINDVLDAHGLPLDTALTALSDADYRDRERTGSAILDALVHDGYVTFKVTSWDGWMYTATGKVWS